MKRVDELQKQYELNQARGEKIKKRIQELRKVSEGLKAEMEEAAFCGDLDLYRAKKAERETAEEELYVLSAQEKDSGFIRMDDAEAAWAERMKPYQKDFEKAQAEVLKAGKILSQAYTALLRVQSDALRDRERLLQYTGTDVDWRYPDSHMEEYFTLPVKIDDVRKVWCNVPAVSPEIMYLVGSGVWPKSEKKDSMGYWIADYCEQADKAYDIIHTYRSQDI